VYGAPKPLSTLREQLRFATEHTLRNLRLFGVFGTHEAPQRLVPYLIRHLEHNEAVDLTPGEQVRDLLFEDDVVQAFLEAAKPN